jgi:uncharacterized protein (TIGR02266 family)
VADPNTRQGKRTPVTLKIKFKSETLEQFIERYAVDVSQGGIFIRTKEPLAVGTQMKFEFQLKDASPLIGGEGTVVWTRENDPSRPAIAPGMGVRFDRLADGSQQVLEKILAEKVKQAPSRTTGDSATKPPMFTDTPTRVAPAPVQEALMGNKSGRTRADSEQTPLPNPMPFHSDAEDFDEKAFEEATKVRSLDELVAETARTDEAETAQVQLPHAPIDDELAARRHARPDTPLAEPPAPADAMHNKAMPDRDSAPGLPSPPAVDSPRPGRLLDTTPSPRFEPAPKEDLAGRTRLGLEPAKAATAAARAEMERGSIPRAITPASELSHPAAPARPSSAPIVIAILVVVAAALAGVWYFVLRDNVAEDNGEAVKTPKGSGGSAVATINGSGSAGSAAVQPNVGSAGSGSAGKMVGSAGSGSAGSAAHPAAPTVDTIIASAIPNATVEVDETSLSGPAPFTAKLEKDKTYKIRVSAPGFVPKELYVKGGQDKVTAKLDPKLHVISVTSEPAGAQIYIDSVAAGKQTPADVELSAAQASKAKIHVGIRKPGFRAVDQVVDSFTDEDTKMTAKVDAKLTAMPVYTGGGQQNNGGNGGQKTGSGSAATGTGSGSGTGSATTGTGSATPPPTGGGSSTGEPEPDFDKRQ